MKPRAMILAAGRGERLRPLTDKIPKPLLQVAGETLLGRHLLALSSANVEKAVINTAWLGWMIRHYVGNGSRFGLDVDYSDEGDRALETGGGIFKALPALGSAPFLLVNADIWTTMDLASITPPGADDLASLVLVSNPAHNPGGDFALDDDRVLNPAGEGMPGETYTYSGIAILRPALFEHCKPGRFSLVPLLRRAIDQGRVCGQVFAGSWFDAGSADRLEQARQFVRESARRK
ncbi:MAG: nucleotidyltransferase family protein [Gammaproteobacteria bacterium]|nr:nucleotidyltransferase family protein [Gammaproteobacteria bacterium]